MPYPKKVRNNQAIRMSFWGIFLVSVVLLSSIIVYVQSRSNTPSEPSEENPNTTTAPTQVHVDLVSHTNETHKYTIGVPEDWTYVSMNNAETYVHSPSSTSVQIWVGDYTPQLLTTTKESVEQSLGVNGYVLSSFEWEANNSYSTAYLHKTSSGDADIVYVEHIEFDRTKAVRLLYTVKAEHLERMNNVMIAILDSFEWTPQNPIPDGLYMYYSQEGRYEFAYPADWTTSVRDNTYFAQDSKTGAAMSVSATKSTASYEGATKEEYYKFAGASRAGFVLTSYSADKNVIYAQGTFKANEQEYVMIQYLLATGTYEYTVTFETPAVAFKEQTALFESALSVFRVFNS